MKYLITTHNIIASVVYLIQYTFQPVNANSCANFDIQSLVNSQVSCQIHSIPIDLNQYRENVTNRAIHLIPDVVMIQRSGGTCARPSHRCVPKTKRIKSIPVMAIIAGFPNGTHERECGHVQVEEHLDCHCNCPITAEECTSQPGVARRFDEGTCRCLCTDTAARSQCISRGMNWDEANCRCICPISRWRFCSTGYVFDYENTCHCIPTSMTASLGLIAAIIVLITCMLGTAIGGFIMYRKQTGIFRKRRSLQSTLRKDQKHNPLLKEAFKNNINTKQVNVPKENSSSIIRGATTPQA